MRTYESFATELLNELIEDGVSQVDPAVILALIELLKNLLPVLLEQCNKKPQQLPDLAQSYLESGGMFQRLGFRLKVRRLAGPQDIIHCTVTGNTSGNPGSGIFCSNCLDPYNPVFTNSIIWGNGATSGAEIYLSNSLIDITFSLFQSRSGQHSSC